MKEQLIDFETAKLAKEKGFDIISLPPYNRLGDIDKVSQSYISDDFAKGATFELWYAPTQSLLQKWLRDVHQIVIDNKHDIKGGEIKYFFDVLRKENKFLDLKDISLLSNSFISHEEGLEVTLFESLKLIK